MIFYIIKKIILCFQKNGEKTPDSDTLTRNPIQPTPIRNISLKSQTSVDAPNFIVRCSPVFPFVGCSPQNLNFAGRSTLRRLRLALQPNSRRRDYTHLISWGRQEIRSTSCRYGSGDSRRRWRPFWPSCLAWWLWWHFDSSFMITTIYLSLPRQCTPWGYRFSSISSWRREHVLVILGFLCLNALRSLFSGS